MPAGIQVLDQSLLYSQTSNTTCPLKPPSNTRVWKSLSRRASHSRLSLSPLKNRPPTLLWETSPSFGRPPPRFMPLHPEAMLASPGDRYVKAFDGPVDPETTRIENVLPTKARPLDFATMTPLAYSKVPLPIPSSVKRIADHQPVSAPASLPHGHRAPAVAFETPVRATSLLGIGTGIGVVPPSTIRQYSRR
jgi:hypothetical protein